MWWWYYIKLEYGESGLNKLIRDYRKRALYKLCVIFDLTKEQFKYLTKQNCYYCGKEPDQIRKNNDYSHGIYVYNGIDRLDNNRGYTTDNTVSCCGLCNKMKLTLTEEQFYKHLLKIVEYKGLTKWVNYWSQALQDL